MKHLPIRTRCLHGFGKQHGCARPGDVGSPRAPRAPPVGAVFSSFFGRISLTESFLRCRRGRHPPAGNTPGSRRSIVQGLIAAQHSLFLPGLRHGPQPSGSHTISVTIPTKPKSEPGVGAGRRLSQHTLPCSGQGQRGAHRRRFSSCFLRRRDNFLSEACAPAPGWHMASLEMS